MSWLVQNLLRDRTKIHTSPDLESDDYNDLIVVEKRIQQLFESGILSEKEMELIEYVSDGKSLSNSKEHFGKHRISTFKQFRNLCNKIAFYLGGYFTDDGYIAYMKEKYDLSDEQVRKMIKYMTNKFKYKLMRKK